MRVNAGTTVHAMNQFKLKVPAALTGHKRSSIEFPVRYAHCRSQWRAADSVFGRAGRVSMVCRWRAKGTGRADNRPRQLLGQLPRSASGLPASAGGGLVAGAGATTGADQ